MTEGDALGIRPSPVVVVEVSLRRAARTEAPVVDVRSCCSVAFDGALTAKPRVDGACLVLGCEVVVDGFVVEEGEAVVVHLSVEIDGAEASGLVIPEALLSVAFDLLSMGAEIVGVESVCGAGRNPELPLGAITGD